jgi:hypothetical protein
MGIAARRIRALCGAAGLLALSNCATTQETMQECRKAAYSFCDKTTGAKDAGSGPTDPVTRKRAYDQCLETQVGACGTP